MPILFGSDKLYNNEECYIGTIAQEIISGPKFQVVDYIRVFSSYNGGILIESLLTIPFFLLFGVNTFSLKLTFLLESVMILILFFLFLDKFFGRKTAIFSSLLFVFSPPGMTVNYLAQGSPYLTTIFFNMAGIFLFYKIFFERGATKTSLVLFGLVLGFMLWVSPFSLALIPLYLMFILLFFKKVQHKKFLIFFLFGFIFGSLPFFYINGFHPLAQTNQIFQLSFSSGYSFIERILFSFENFFLIFSKYMVNSFYFYKTPLSNVTIFSYFYYGLIMVSFLYFILRFFYNIHNGKELNKIDKKQILIFIQIVYLVIVFSVTDLVFNPNRGLDAYRYIYMLYPLLFIFLGIFFTRMIDLHKKSNLLLLFLLLFFLLFFNLKLLSPSNAVPYLPTCLNNVAREIDNLEFYTDLNLDICENFPSMGKYYCYKKLTGITRGSNIGALDYCNGLRKNKKFCFVAFAENLVYVHIDEEHNLDYSSFEKDCQMLDISYQPYCYIGLGYALTKEVKYNLDFNISSICLRVNNNFTNNCYEGYGQQLANEFIFGSYFSTSHIIGECDRLDSLGKVSCYNGIGRLLARQSSGNKDWAFSICDSYNNGDFIFYCKNGVEDEYEDALFYDSSIN